MKKILMIGLPFLLLIGAGVAYMTQASEDASSLGRVDKLFLLEAGDLRMRCWAEGNLAAEKGTIQKVRQYGKRLMRDQDKMMAELRELMALKNLTLPDQLTEKSAKELNTLKVSTGETFDRRFRRMIISTHKRDIEQFQQALTSNDADIRDFATRYVAMLETHLEMARDLNK